MDEPLPKFVLVVPIALPVDKTEPPLRPVPFTLLVVELPEEPVLPPVAAKPAVFVEPEGTAGEFEPEFAPPATSVELPDEPLVVPALEPDPEPEVMPPVVPLLEPAVEPEPEFMPSLVPLLEPAVEPEPEPEKLPAVPPTPPAVEPKLPEPLKPAPEPEADPEAVLVKPLAPDAVESRPPLPRPNKDATTEGDALGRAFPDVSYIRPSKLMS